MKINIKEQSKNQWLGLLVLVLAALSFASCVDIFNPPDESYHRMSSSQTSSQSESVIFSAPANFSARQISATTAQLTWNEVADAVGYKAERAAGGDGDYIEIYNGTGTSYTDTLDSPGTDEYYYRVTAYKDDESASALPRSVIFQNIIVYASQHANFPEITDANNYGVYPVKITWKKPDDSSITSFQIERSANGADFDLIGTVGLNASLDADGYYYFVDKNSEAKVAKKYHYRVRFLGNSNQVLLTSDAYSGWGALTHERYMIEYNKVMNTALGRLTLMYKTPDTSKIGSETKNGGISGTIAYTAKLISLGLGGAEITIKLTNYSDFRIEGDSSMDSYFILNGDSDTKTSMAAAGNMRGTMVITGMYPGTVVYGTIWSTTVNANAGITISGGKAGGGNYVVTPDGFADKKVPYNQNTPEPGIFMATANFNASDPEIESDKKLPWLNW